MQSQEATVVERQGARPESNTSGKDELARSRSGAHAPGGTLEQRMAALDKANAIRTARAHLKRDVKAKRVTASRIVLDPPDYAEGLQVRALLLEAPKLGRVKVDRMLVSLRIPPGKTIVGLSERQRTGLYAELRGRDL